MICLDHSYIARLNQFGPKKFYLVLEITEDDPVMTGLGPFYKVYKPTDFRAAFARPIGASIIMSMGSSLALYVDLWMNTDLTKTKQELEYSQTITDVQLFI
jgi:hypothetical protein